MENILKLQIVSFALYHNLSLNNKMCDFYYLLFHLCMDIMLKFTTQHYSTH